MTKISALPAASVANDSDLLEIVQAGANRRVTVGQIIAQVPADPVQAAVSIEQYGASPGASGATNSAAIEAALAANRTVYIPDGVYNIADQYDGMPNGATRRICIRVPANRTILGPGTLQFTTPPPPAPGVLRGGLSIVGSHVRIRSVTFNDAHVSVSGSTCRLQGIVIGDGEDPAVTSDLEDIVIDDCRFTNNFYPVVVRAAASTPRVMKDIRIFNCIGIAHPDAGFSGGFSVYGMDPQVSTTQRAIRNCVMAFNTMRGPKTSHGMGFYGTAGGTMIGNTVEDCLFSGIEMENGSEDVAMIGNRTLRSGIGLWVDDGRNMAIVGNVANVTPTTPTGAGSPVQVGIFVSRAGFDGETAYETTGIVAASNVVSGAGISTAAYGGAPEGSFGSITVAGNDVRNSAATPTATALSMSSGGSKNVIGNTLKGGSTATISLSASASEPTTLVGNVTSKIAAEASTGITSTGTPVLVYGFNEFTNGIGAISTSHAQFGNRDAGAAQMLAQTGHIINYGSGSPESVVTGTTGDIYQRTDTTTTSYLALYIKLGGGNTGWRSAQVISSGNTAGRPPLTASTNIGFRYFDTTLGKPVWWNGTVWKDAAGTTV